MVSQVSGKVQAVVNGQTVTIAELTNINVSGGTGFANNSLALNLSHPVKIDPDTAITFVTSGQGITSLWATCVHLVEERR